MSPRSGSKSIPLSDLPERVLAVDPGREKTGLAVVEADGSCPYRAIVPTERLRAEAEALVARFELRLAVVGDRTHTREASAALQSIPGLEVRLVNEHRSTEEARALYFRQNPPRGLARLVPAGLRTPPGPIDDYAAWVLGRRWYGAQG